MTRILRHSSRRSSRTVARTPRERAREPRDARARVSRVSRAFARAPHRARAPSRRRVLCENISHSPKRDVDDEERVPIASHRAYTYKTKIFIHNSLIASRHRTVASRNRTVGRARARIFTRLLKALFGGNYHAEHLSGGGADPDLMSATHCGEKI